MKNDYIDKLIQAVTRVVSPNAPLLKDVLVIGGMPEPTQNLRYLSYNRHTTMEHGFSCEFSAVAVINNRRAREWQLVGTSKKISGWVFSSRWTRNPLDLFLNNLRCDPSVIEVLAEADGAYTLLGILTMSDFLTSSPAQRSEQYICPVVAIPGMDADALQTVKAFEAANRIQKSGFIGLQLYRKRGSLMV
jgi:hypothetical protein